MLQRRAQIRCAEDRDKGQNGVQIVQRHLNRVYRRRTRGIERGRKPFDLREGWVGVQREEGLKPLIPIRQRAQHGERGGRTKPIHAVLRADYMAASAMGHRKFFTQCCIAVYDFGGVGAGNLETGAEGRALIRSKAFDRAFADIRQQPVTKPLLFRVVLNAQVIDDLATHKNRIALGTGIQRHNALSIADYPYPGLE